MASLMVNDCVPPQERKLAEHAEAEAKAALAAKAAAASLAATAAKDAAVELATDAASEAAKKLRASQKKLRQATELLEQKAAGAELNKDQRDKIKTIPTLEAEILELTISTAELEKVAAAAVAQRQAERVAEEAARQAAVARAAAEAEAARQRAEAQRKEEAAKRCGERGLVEQMMQMDMVAIAELLGVDRFKYVCPEWRS